MYGVEEECEENETSGIHTFMHVSCIHTYIPEISIIHSGSIQVQLEEGKRHWLFSGNGRPNSLPQRLSLTRLLDDDDDEEPEDDRDSKPPLLLSSLIRTSKTSSTTSASYLSRGWQ